MDCPHEGTPVPTASGSAVAIPHGQTKLPVRNVWVVALVLCALRMTNSGIPAAVPISSLRSKRPVAATSPHSPVLALSPVARPTFSVKVPTNEYDTMRLKCPDGQVMTQVLAASYGLPSIGQGSCPNFFSPDSACHSGFSDKPLNERCLGRNSCEFKVENGLFGGDPCGGPDKRYSVAVTCCNNVGPHKTCGAVGGYPNILCSSANEYNDISLSCPPGQVMTHFDASYGLPTIGVQCPMFYSMDNTCHSAVTVRALNIRCLNQNSCRFRVENSFFADDPCVGTDKRLAVQATCCGGAPANFVNLDDVTCPAIPTQPDELRSVLQSFLKSKIARRGRQNMTTEIATTPEKSVFQVVKRDIMNSIRQIVCNGIMAISSFKLAMKCLPSKRFLGGQPHRDDVAGIQAMIVRFGCAGLELLEATASQEARVIFAIVQGVKVFCGAIFHVGKDNGFNPCVIT
ncbi:hypothetical protein HK102_007925 [Quaeritorhiza haematococci]|nr:hypothetical protein HK102_007925 [Quaeritorhiza haematococci]